MAHTGYNKPGVAKKGTVRRGAVVKGRPRAKAKRNPSRARRGRAWVALVDW